MGSPPTCNPLQIPMNQPGTTPQRQTAHPEPSKITVYTLPLFEVYNEPPTTSWHQPRLMLSTAIPLLCCLAVGSQAYVVGAGAQAVPGTTCTSCQQPPPPCNTCNNPVMGNWGEWGPWSQCSSAYGSPSQTRQRVCSAAQCPGGSSSESRPCVQYDPSPQWGEWTSYGTCSASCGGGVCTRTRVCNNGCSSCQCVGPSTDQKPCNTQPCCDWTAWSQWSPCSVTCGAGGYRSRTRQCTCSSGCVGNSSQQEECNANIPCPVSVCQTCQPQYEPPPCSSCNQPPPPCNTCGGPYDPYGRKKRALLPATNNSTRV